MSTPPPMPASPVPPIPPKKKKGCLAWLGIGFVILVIVGMFADSPADKWADQKEELLPDIEAALKDGDFERALSLTEAFKDVDDGDLKRVRYSATAMKLESARVMQAEARAKKAEVIAKEITVLKNELEVAKGDDRWEIIGKLQKRDPNSVELGSVFAELDAHKLKLIEIEKIEQAQLKAAQDKLELKTLLTMLATQEQQMKKGEGTMVAENVERAAELAPENKDVKRWVSIVERLKKIKAQFSDGQHMLTRVALNRSLHDPSSYQHVSTNYVDEGETIKVTTEYRAKNSFNALVLQEVVIRVDVETGSKVEVISE